MSATITVPVVTTQAGLSPQRADQDQQKAEVHQQDEQTIDLVLRQLRALIGDLCQQFDGGHPGGAIGMIAIGIALWKYTMRYSPRNPQYFNRDRFVLSNGHTSLLQYIFLHVTGYEHMTMDQLRSYHSYQYNSLCPSHPEIHIDGIEVTTGHLGQGIANAVGLAMASKNLAATYNQPGLDVISSTTWCMVGDACLQEGVALEAIQLAGHWRLNNLVVIYDNNSSTCEGSLSISSSELINPKMEACGWDVIDVPNGSYDVAALVSALSQAKNSTSRPTFINVHTVIGIGSAVQGTEIAHGMPFGAEGVRTLKRNLDLDPDQSFIISDEVYAFFENKKEQGDTLERIWKQTLNDYCKEHPQLHADFMSRVRGNIDDCWADMIPRKANLPTEPISSTGSAEMVCSALGSKFNNFMIGTGDLTPCIDMRWEGKVDFQHPELETTCGSKGDYSGRYIHWGIREHAMCAISNGLAAFNKGTFLPIASSFLIFYIYAAASVRMAALQDLQVIYIATHDSIGYGADGPTHQPVGLPSLFRALPNFYYIRPCDGEETAGAMITALEMKSSPTMLSLSSQPLEQYPQHSSRDGTRKGAYLFKEEASPDVTIIGVGSEMHFAMEAEKILRNRYQMKARIVSFPCQRLFEAQSVEYKRETLMLHSDIPRVVIEAYASNGWERYANAGYHMSTYGKSLPGTSAYEYFGFNGSLIAGAIAQYVEEVRLDATKYVLREYKDLR